MKSSIIFLAAFAFVKPLQLNVCTDLKNVPHMFNNYTVVGELILTEVVVGLLHCVEKCKVVPPCKAFTYSTLSRACSMYPHFGFSRTELNGSILYSAIADWTKQVVNESSAVEVSLRAGFDCYVMQGTKAYYNGTVTVDRSGYTCQIWDSQTPHKHGYGVEASDFQTGETMDEVANYCRVSISDPAPTPWCYTTSVSQRWDYCDIQECPSDSG